MTCFSDFLEMLQRGILGCARPDELAVLAGGPVLIANMTGFRVVPSCGVPELSVPSVRVYVHPPAEDHIVSKGLLETGSWAHAGNERTRRSIIGLMMQLLAAGGSFMDIGANIGTFSLPLLAAGYPGMLFEASPHNAWRLRASVCAIGPLANAAATIVAPVALGNGSAGTACMREAKTANAGAMSVATTKSGQCDGYEVPSAQLDNVFFSGKEDGMATCANLVALKIDVESHELEVFRGADRVLRQCRPRHIFIEGGRKTAAVKLLIHTYGYRIRGTYERGHDTHLVLRGVNDCWSKK